MATTISTSQTASTLPQKKGDPPNFGTVKSGRALAFDGVVDYLETSTIHSFDEESNITIACWFNIDSAPASDGAYIVNLPETVGGNNGIDIRIDADEIIFSIATHSDSSLTDVKFSFTTGTWYRAVLTYDGVDLKGYINGSLIGTHSVTVGSGILHASSSLYMGKFSASAGTIFFDGKISDVQVWSSAWTLTDVQNDYRHPEMLAHTLSGTSLTESNLKIWYPMTEGNPESPQTTIFDGSPKVLGSELVTNGGFDTDSSWTATNFTIADGVATTSTSGAELQQSLAISTGDTIKIVAEIKNYTSGTVRFYTGHGSDKYASFSGNGVHTYYIEANNAKVFFLSQSFVGSLDNVSVKKVQRGNHAKSVFFGDNLISNGGFETNTTGWSAQGTLSTGITHNTSHAKVGAKSMSFVAGQAEAGAYAGYTTVTGKTYKVDFWAKPLNSETKIRLVLREGDGSGWSAVSDLTLSSYSTDTGTVGSGNWYNITYEYTEASGGSSAQIRILSASDDADGTFAIDEVSIKEVGLSDQSTAMGQETIFQPAFVGQSRKKVFGDKGTWVNFTQINDIDDGKSISFWMCPNKFIQNMMVLGANATASNIVIHSTTVIRMEADASGHYIDWTVPTMSIGNWYHCVVVFNGDDGYSLYLNGSFISTQDLDTFGTGGVDWDQIGGDNGSSVNFHGILDEISYWTKELTQSDVIEMYNDGVPLDLLTHSSTSDLVNYWRNNNLNTGGYWKDLKGSSHGTFNKTNDYEIILPEGTTSGRDINGFFLTHPNKNYLSCDANTYIDVPHSNVFDFGTGDFSLECWAKLSDTNSAVNGAGLVIKQENYNLNTAGYGLYWRQDDKTVIFNVGDGTDGIRIVSSALNLNQWYHIVGTYNGTTGAGILYIDKSSAGTATDSTIDSTDTSLDVEIGRETTKYHNGFVDDVRIYGKVLSTDEIAKNYRHGSGKHKD